MKEITLGTLFDGIGGFPYADLFGAFMRGNKPPVLLGEDKNFSV